MQVAGPRRGPQGRAGGWWVGGRVFRVQVVGTRRCTQMRAGGRFGVGGGGAQGEGGSATARVWIKEAGWVVGRLAGRDGGRVGAGGGGRAGRAGVCAGGSATALNY